MDKALDIATERARSVFFKYAAQHHGKLDFSVILAVYLVGFKDGSQPLGRNDCKHRLRRF